MFDFRLGREKKIGRPEKHQQDLSNEMTESVAET